MMARYREKRARLRAENARRKAVRKATSGISRLQRDIERADTRITLLVGQIIPRTEEHISGFEAEIERLHGRLVNYDGAGRRWGILRSSIDRNLHYLSKSTNNLREQQARTRDASC